MACSIYRVDLELGRRYAEGSLKKHTEMSHWLNINGQTQFIYEIWKSKGLHSRWNWKIKKNKWGRMATPRKNTTV